MRGQVVEGFVIGELLGSGRTGLLYHAAHETTCQKAIVRVVTREDRVETELFIQEACAHLPTAGGPELLRARLDDGRIVHLVFNGAGTVTTPVNQREVPTERLLPTPLEPPSRGVAPAWLVPGLLLLIVVIGGGLGALLLLRSAASSPIVVLQEPRAAEAASAAAPATKVPVANSEPPVAVAPARGLSAQPSEPQPATPEARPPAKPVLVAAATRAGVEKPEDCEPDDDWRRSSRHFLDEMGRNVAAQGGSALEIYVNSEPSIAQGIGRANTASECADVTRRLDELHRRLKYTATASQAGPVPALITRKSMVRPAEKVVVEQACNFDDRFREYARRTRADLRTMKGSETQVFSQADDRLADALIEKDCHRAGAALTEMRRQVGAPTE